jgi:hypothetical protein
MKISAPPPRTRIRKAGTLGDSVTITTQIALKNPSHRDAGRMGSGACARASAIFGRSAALCIDEFIVAVQIYAGKKSDASAAPRTNDAILMPV